MAPCESAASLAPRSPHTHRLTLRPAGRYRLEAALRGHGWYQLAPHDWDGEREILTTRIAVDVRAPRRLGTPELETVRAGLRRVLQLDVDLEPFWAKLRDDPSDGFDLGWVVDGAYGYLMQSPSLFEDLVKILLTTNCTWAFTKTMCRRIVDAIGPVAPDGERAFPDPMTCAAMPEAFWREEIRVGYRARAIAHLAEGFATGALRSADFEDPELPEQELRRRLSALPGFGPYAVGHALRGLGCYRELAIDSWCRARAVECFGMRRPPSDRWFGRQVRRFAPYEGLALWFWLSGPDVI